jgi:hypothetical protein
MNVSSLRVVTNDTFSVLCVCAQLAHGYTTFRIILEREFFVENEREVIRAEKCSAVVFAVFNNVVSETAEATRLVGRQTTFVSKVRRTSVDFVTLLTACAGAYLLVRITFEMLATDDACMFDVHESNVA